MIGAAGLFGETAKHTRGSYADRVSLADVAGVVLQAASTSEQVDGNTWRLFQATTCYVPPGSDIRSTDWLTIRGKEWQVDGEPVEEVSAFTGHRGMVAVSLKAVS